MKSKKPKLKKFQNLIKFMLLKITYKTEASQSWLNESYTSSKLISKSLNEKVIYKLGSQSFLMRNIK